MTSPLRVTFFTSAEGYRVTISDMPDGICDVQVDLPSEQARAYQEAVIEAMHRHAEAAEHCSHVPECFMSAQLALGAKG